MSIATNDLKTRLRRYLRSRTQALFRLFPSSFTPTKLCPLCASFDSESASSKSPHCVSEPARKTSSGSPPSTFSTLLCRQCEVLIQVPVPPLSHLTSNDGHPQSHAAPNFHNRGPHTGSSHEERCAMAGNDHDLLKQATQAMMSRYEGKNTWRSLLPSGCAAWRGTQVVISQLRHHRGESTKFGPDALCGDCASCSRPLPGVAFAMMSLAHASTSKLTRVLSMRQSVAAGAP